MTDDFILHLGKRTLEVALLISAPALVVSVVVGFGTAMLQAVTSIRDMTLGMVLKLAAIGGALLVFGNWMIRLGVSFTVEVMSHVQQMGQ